MTHINECARRGVRFVGSWRGLLAQHHFCGRHARTRDVFATQNKPTTHHATQETQRTTRHGHHTTTQTSHHTLPHYTQHNAESRRFTHRAPLAARTEALPKQQHNNDDDDGGGDDEESEETHTYFLFLSNIFSKTIPFLTSLLCHIFFYLDSSSR